MSSSEYTSDDESYDSKDDVLLGVETLHDGSHYCIMPERPEREVPSIPQWWMMKFMLY